MTNQIVTLRKLVESFEIADTNGFFPKGVKVSLIEPTLIYSGYPAYVDLLGGFIVSYCNNTSREIEGTKYNNFILSIRVIPKQREEQLINVLGNIHVFFPEAIESFEPTVQKLRRRQEKETKKIISDSNVQMSLFD